MTLASLNAFLEAASRDGSLQEQLLRAPDAAALAAIAQAAGYAVREADWLLASEASREEISAGDEAVAPDPDPLTAFLHQAQGDPELLRALAEAPDAAAVAAIAQAAGYPITAAELWAASAAAVAEIAPPQPWEEADDGRPDEPTPVPGAGEEVLERFLRQLASDPEMQAAVAAAADAAAVALLAQAAGHPLREIDLWRASGLEPIELLAQPASGLMAADADDLTAFLHQTHGDASLQAALAQAADGAALVAIAQAAGYRICPADLWAASGVEPGELASQAGQGAVATA
jgi:predicted ribosomally synthesized peptide with nif11-like leader